MGDDASLKAPPSDSLSEKENVWLAEILQPTERLIWAGRPAARPRLRKIDILLIPVSVLWLGMLVQLNDMVAPMAFIFLVTGNAISPFVLVFAVIFNLIGIWITIGRFIHEWLRLRYTLYAISDSRIVILSRFLGRAARSIPIHGISSVVLREGSGARGTVAIWSENRVVRVIFWLLLFKYWINRPITPSLEGVAHANALYGLLQRLMARTWKARVEAA